MLVNCSENKKSPWGVKMKTVQEILQTTNRQQLIDTYLNIRLRLKTSIPLKQSVKWKKQLVNN